MERVTSIVEQFLSDIAEIAKIERSEDGESITVVARWRKSAALQAQKIAFLNESIAKGNCYIVAHDDDLIIPDGSRIIETAEADVYRFNTDADIRPSYESALYMGHWTFVIKESNVGAHCLAIASDADDDCWTLSYDSSSVPIRKRIPRDPYWVYLAGIIPLALAYYALDERLGWYVFAIVIPYLFLLRFIAEKVAVKSE